MNYNNEEKNREVFHMEKKELNQIYSRLRARCMQLMDGLDHRAFESEWGWYGGHYYKNEEGEYERAEYPIPVISVKGLCDVEISLDQVSVSTKRRRLDTLAYSFEKFQGVPFECFSIEDYLGQDYYNPGLSMEEFRNRMEKSQEAALGFSFLFGFDVDAGFLSEFAKLLCREGFFY